MQDDENLPVGSVLGNGTLLLWLAAALAVVFLGLLVLDLIKRRRRARHHRRSEPKSLRARLLKPVHRAQAFRSDLEQILDERSRRNDRHSRRPPEPPP